MKYHIIPLCVLGSIVRFLYGFFFAPWQQASDQIAWEIVLNEGTWSYDRLIHYPHEGGSILISILSRFCLIFSDFNCLVITAFIIDFFSRYIQLSIVQRIFEDKVFYSFGLWTIFATPTILPWATVNFGLHSIASFFPFILLYILWIDKDTIQYHIKNGLFLGFAVWFSYSNIVLIPIYFLFQMIKENKSKTWIYSFLSLMLVLAFHIVIRLNFDAGFHLEQMNLTSIRGTNFSLGELNTWTRIFKVWFTSLSAAAIAVPNSVFILKYIKYLWLLMFFVGVITCLRAYYRGNIRQSIAVNIVVIVLFIMTYAISPFYTNPKELGNYVSYRHLTYILPFIALFVIIGLNTLKYKSIYIGIFLLIGVFSSSLLFTQKPSAETAEKAAGWTLSSKFGHEPKRLYQIILSSQYNHHLLLQGVGWGLSASLFNITEKEHEDLKIKMLMDIIKQFPDDCKEDLMEGIKFAFSSEVTPPLRQEIFVKVLDKMED